MLTVNVSLAAYAGVGFVDALTRATQDPPTEPVLGQLALCETQLCPQNGGILTEQLAVQLKSAFAQTRLRLHANVRCLPARHILDLSRWHDNRPYWDQLARISRAIDAPAYTAHAGRRSESSFGDVLYATQAAEDLFGCPVGVEGHYPTASMDFHVATWAEYREVMESQVKYVVDLSHLNIVATGERQWDIELVKALVANPRCIEVHLSSNNGQRDQHFTLSRKPWWWAALEHINADATLFSEGAQPNKARQAHQ